jgi:hypothetical protein
MSERAQSNTTGYLFVYFTGLEEKSTDEQIYFAISHDGCVWNDLQTDGNPILSSTVGERGVRDSFLVRAADGKHFYLIATDLSIFHRGGWKNSNASESGSTSLVIWESEDLVHWTAPRLVDVASTIPDAGMAWAPEALWIESDQQYMVYWSTRSEADNHVGDPTNVYYATTTDFEVFSDPVLWIDREHSVIDTTMIQADDGYFYRASQDGTLMIERTKNPYAVSIGEYNHSDDPKQWTAVYEFKKPFANPQYIGEYLEGPELFFYNPNDARPDPTGAAMIYGLMWDQHKTGNGYLPFRSSDLGSSDPIHWELASDVDFGSLKKRHGAILPITEDEYKRLKTSFLRENPASSHEIQG